MCVNFLNFYYVYKYLISFFNISRFNICLVCWFLVVFYKIKIAY